MKNDHTSYFKNKQIEIPMEPKMKNSWQFFAALLTSPFYSWVISPSSHFIFSNDQNV